MAATMGVGQLVKNRGESAVALGKVYKKWGHISVIRRLTIPPVARYNLRERERLRKLRASSTKPLGEVPFFFGYHGDTPESIYQPYY